MTSPSPCLPQASRRHALERTSDVLYRRSLKLRSGAKSFVDYAVLPTEAKPNPVPLVAEMPPGGAPPKTLADCLACDCDTAGYFVTALPRSQSRHYRRIAESGALDLYPDLLHKPYLLALVDAAPAMHSVARVAGHQANNAHPAGAPAGSFAGCTSR